ncbi:MAG: efflux RND transporter periplasmic adaptor subunit [bacterium]|nr:efflux RND transporter periplasmic adaptor subunit [bacterium]
MPVRRGPFEVRLVEAGSISALHSTTIDVPALRMNMQILWLVEEGSSVEAGDTLVRFDATEARKQVEEKEAGLDIALAALRKGEAEHESEMASLKSTLTYDSISWRLSRLQADRSRWESEVARQEAELQFHQSTLALEKSLARSRAQETIGRESLGSLELKVAQARAELATARQSLEQMVIRAPQRGMVVYLPIWKGDRMGKVKAGDTPWRGSSILELPDFDTMLVDLRVNEVDVGLVKVGDSCGVALDAWPDRRFSGRVLDMGVLASERDDESGIKAFDLRVRLDQSDPILKPGMNARATIFGFREEDALTVPVEALHQDEAGWHVWLAGKDGARRQAIEPGPGDGDRVLVQSGLAEGDAVLLGGQERRTPGARSSAPPPATAGGGRP